MRQVGDLVYVDGATLQARAAVDVQLEPALDVPLDLLAEPTVNQTRAHFEANHFVLKLHQVVEDRNVTRLIYAVEQVGLDDLPSVVPLLLLAQLLAPLQAVVHHIVRGFAVVAIDLPLGHFGVQALGVLPVRVSLIGRVCCHHRRLFERVRDRKACALQEGLVHHREELVGHDQDSRLVDMIGKLRALWNRLIEIYPCAPKLLHLCTQLVHRLEQKTIGGSLGVLNVKECEALVVKLAVKLKKLFERRSCLLL